jgi:hypothetical protein
VASANPQQLFAEIEEHQPTTGCDRLTRVLPLERHMITFGTHIQPLLLVRLGGVEDPHHVAVEPLSFSDLVDRDAAVLQLDNDAVCGDNVGAMAADHDFAGGN